MPFPFMAAATTAAAAAAAFGAHKASREAKKSRKHQKGFQKAQKNSKSTKYANRLARRNLKLLKKYGAPKFQQKPALNKKQNKLLDYLTKHAKQLPNFQNIKNAPLYQQGQANLMDLLSQTPEAYEKFKNPIMQQFQQETIPDIGTRYSEVGAQRSSGFQNALGEAGANLSGKLGLLKAQLGLQALDPALRYAQAPIENQQRQFDLTSNLGRTSLGTNPFVNLSRGATFASGAGGAQQQQYQPQQGPFSSFFSGLAPGVGQGLGQGLGSGISDYIGGLFKDKLGVA